MCMSRARKMFIFVYATKSFNDNTKLDKPSRFITEIFGKSIPEQAEIIPQQQPDTTNIKDVNNPFHLLRVLNVSQHTSSSLLLDLYSLRLYLRCPVSFGLKSILKIDTKYPRNSIYQNAVFKSIKMMFKNVINPKSSILEDMRINFEEVHTQQGIAPNDIQPHAYTSAMTMFEKLYMDAENYQIKNIYHNWKFKIDDRTELTGEIDRIYFEEEKTTLVQSIQYDEVYADIGSSTLTFFSNVLALICRSEFNFIPDNIILQYIHNKRLKQVHYKPEEIELANTLNSLKNISDKIHEGKFHGASNLSLCKSCVYKFECPHSLAIAK